MSGEKIRKKAQILLDIILPNFVLDPNMPTDDEASALYEMWKRAPQGEKSFAHGDRSMVNAWKAKGLVDGISDCLSLTDKGRKVIRDMVTNEPNSFDKTAKMPAYSNIKEAQKKRRNPVTGKVETCRKTAFNLSRNRKSGR